MIPHAILDRGSATAPLRTRRQMPIRDQPGRHPVNGRLWDYAGEHHGFHGWLDLVNRRVQAITGLSLLDLPDRNWRDEYDGRVPPEEAADVAIDETCAEFGIDLT